MSAASARRAVCLRCGGDKIAFDHICPACGHLPEGEGLLVAWLLSSEHLDGAQLDATAERVRAGASIRPSDKLLERARVALGRHESRDPGLTLAQQAGLLATSALLTPAVGLTIWAWWRTERPRTARQALLLSLPIGVISIGLVAWAWWRLRVG